MREYCSSFYIEECWGYNQFILISELGNGFITESGDLVFNVNVRNPSYKSLVSDQNNYINYLEEKITNLSGAGEEEFKIPNKVDNGKMKELTKLSK
jgi:hypothetical protein